MLAGDIRIGKDIIIGTGDIILGAVLLAFLAGFVYLWIQSAREEWREWRLIRAAKAMELAEGVTLLEGVQACFNSDVFWFVSDDAVDVITGPYSHLHGRMRVYPDTGRIDVYMFRRDPALDSKNEPEAMLGAMIQAVRDKVTYKL